MTLRFDLSAAAQRGASTCGVCDDGNMERRFLETQPQLRFPDPPIGVPTAPQLSFSLGLGAASRPFNAQTGLVRRFATPVLQRLGIAPQPPEKKCKRADDEEHDQYTIRPGRSMCWSVLFHNDTGFKHPGSLLGDYGHIERLSAWVHLVGGIGFLVYAVLRPLAITDEHTIAESLATSAAGAVAFAFLSSTVYHVTAASKTLTVWTRQLDYIGIYTALAVGCVADFAIATRGFENVSILSVVDGPLACTVTAVFFLIRRALISADETWDTYLGGCTLTFGLMRRGHLDLDHTGTRQSTSFLLAISYFVTIPSLFTNFGTRNATTILLLELGCLLLLVVGMLVDNLIVFPDKALSEGRGPNFLVCKPCGCIGYAQHPKPSPSTPGPSLRSTNRCIAFFAVRRMACGTCSPSRPQLKAHAAENSPLVYRGSCNFVYGLNTYVLLPIARFLFVLERLALVAVGAQEIALGHLNIEDVLDLVECGTLDAVVHEAGDAAAFAREGALSNQLGGLVAMVELERQRHWFLDSKGHRTWTTRRWR
jgi:hypothetical protein